MKGPQLAELALLALCAAWSSDAFSVIQSLPRFSRTSSLIATSTKPQSSVPEYIVKGDTGFDDADGFEDDDDGEDFNEVDGQDDIATETLTIQQEEMNGKSSPTTAATTTTSSAKPKLQFVALEPGTVVHVQVGDISLARKAWKKRRRSGSPLLVPCSVLNVDRQSAVRWNCLYLLKKFGNSVGNSGSMLRLSIEEIAGRHRKHLQSSLKAHATAMGFTETQEMMEAVFNKQVQETFGVRLIHDGEKNKNYLQTSLSRVKARKRADNAALLQVCEEEEDTLRHTGIVRNRKQQQQQAPENSGEDGATTNSSLQRPQHFYQLKPLSAALRVNQADVDAGTIQNGSFHAAVVFDYDAAGDNGSPMLTLSLNPANVRERLKMTSISIEGGKLEVIRNPKHLLQNLHVGDGPIKGKVVRLIKGGALVDCNVGRVKANQPDAYKVYGTLSFKDAVISSSNDPDDDDEDDEDDWEDILATDDAEEEEEEEDDDDEKDDGKVSYLQTVLQELDDDEEFKDSEDITHLCVFNEDGTITYTDPDTGEVTVISMDTDHDHDHDHEDDDDDDDEEEEEEEEEQKKPRKQQQQHRHRDSKVTSQRLHVGDQINVFVKSVPKQSGQLILTMNASIKGRKAKDLKKEGDVNKKMQRLYKQLGGSRRLEELRGQEYDGIVKAVSNTGDWFYVQPPSPLPVGIARVADSDEALFAMNLQPGDAVRIQIEGADESRGQLAMRILKKK